MQIEIKDDLSSSNIYLINHIQLINMRFLIRIALRSLEEDMKKYSFTNNSATAELIDISNKVLDETDYSKIAIANYRVN